MGKRVSPHFEAGAQRSIPSVEPASVSTIGGDASSIGIFDVKSVEASSLMRPDGFSNNSLAAIGGVAGVPSKHAHVVSKVQRNPAKGRGTSFQRKGTPDLGTGL